ncbi:TetR family transcriptional regulator [Streptomyces sp. NPDC012888]|uniref:TetR family transcriptional regulator n=1 Tax=Streptomyces sp. NPDC012888 TaxID=3364855 RepID=UPI0036899D0D
MARDSSATRARLLDAAFTEFAQYGIAGARVDRIAESARANKRLIYVYYGNKEQLFDAVLTRAMELGAESVPFTAGDLPEYAGAVFDHLVARPELMRLVLWRQLERPAPAAAESEAYRVKAAQVRAAQASGAVDPQMDPVDVLLLVNGLAQAWFAATGGPAQDGAGTQDGAGAPDGVDAPWDAGRTARHRAAVVEAVRRLVTAP